MSVSVKFPNATVTAIQHKKGVIRLTIEAPQDETDATVSDLNEMSLGAMVFRGTVSIKGKAIQQPLDFETNRPGKPGTPSDD